MKYSYNKYSYGNIMSIYLGTFMFLGSTLCYQQHTLQPKSRTPIMFILTIGANFKMSLKGKKNSASVEV